jgi:excisionase family DNA binding protein
MHPDEQEPPPLRRFFRVDEVARMLSLETEAVQHLVESGELPAVRLGPREEWRVEERLLDEYLEAKYEQTRRAVLWRGFDFASVADLDPEARPQKPGADPAPQASAPQP